MKAAPHSHNKITMRQLKVGGEKRLLKSFEAGACRKNSIKLCAASPENEHLTS
jgi:hypothetical protein